VSGECVMVHVAQIINYGSVILWYLWKFQQLGVLERKLARILKILFSFFFEDYVPTINFDVQIVLSFCR
jgi:hypothetical protein